MTNWGRMNGLVSNREIGTPAAGRPQPVSLVRWRSPTAQTMRVTLHPLRTTDGSEPNPSGAIYSSETAGGFSRPPVLVDIVRGLPVNLPAYVVMRWGVAAYQTQVIADWPRRGGGFDVAGDNIEIDGLLAATTGDRVQFGAHLSPGERANPESVQLGYTQTFVPNNIDTAALNVPGYAQRCCVRTNKVGTIACSWVDAAMATVGVFVVGDQKPTNEVVPPSAVALVVSTTSGAPTLTVNWSICP